ncbi:MAG: sulfatase-like hydrolase/transferase [Woeseiaceae bacterium]
MKNKKNQISRRDFVKGTGSAAIAAGTGLSLQGLQSARAQGSQKYNILLIVTDQEQHMMPPQLPAGYRLPAHEKLASQGVVFENHQIASCVCTPSRSVIYTGQHIQNNGMFDNTNFPWSNDLSTEIPTVGDMLRRLGYYTAYKGKWHLTDEFETANDVHMPQRILSAEMEEYGFADYFGIGDMIAHTEGGYLHDGVTTAMTKSWLRGKATNLNADDTPWFMAVNLVNPHDVMYYNTDLPDGPVEQGKKAMMHLNRDPETAQFSRQWDVVLPESRKQDVSGPGRPAAHLDFADSRAGLVGRVPNEDDRWRRLNNYYLNCIQSADSHVLEILDELDDVGMADNTIIIYTSDHGEHAGAHGVNGKGATGYREQNNVPFIVSHPDIVGGKNCKAVTSHLDITTTVISMAGGDPDSEKNLYGKDFSPLLHDPASAPYDAIRPGALFNYNMFAYLDREFISNISTFLRDGGDPADLPNQSWRPNLANRGAIRGVYDGRYKLNRYFSPQEHHLPQSLEELIGSNDVELFDTENDPHEVNNLALDLTKNGDLMVAMNDKLNALIESEVGEDIGQMLPGGEDADWTLDPSISRLRM